MSTYAKIQDISPLASVSPVFSNINNHKFTVDWDLPDTFTQNTAYIRLYRYIGDKDTCVDINDIPQPPLNGAVSNDRTRLIYQIKQNFNSTTGLSLSTYETKTYNFDGSEKNITNVASPTAITLKYFTDNFASIYSNDSLVLKTAYDIVDVDNDRQLLNEIYTTERTIYYIVATYVQGIPDAAPYCVATHNTTDRVDSFSTKTQVLHDVLHYEFDMVWQTRSLNRSGGTTGKSISRTAVDINQLYLDAAQRGPTGRGGAVWVSDRGSNGDVYRFDLSTGLQVGRGSNPQGASWGHGVAVDVNSGDCISANAEGHIRQFAYDSPSFLLNTTNGPNIPDRKIYGAANIPGHPSKIVLNARSPIPSHMIIYNVQTKSLTEIGTFSPEIYGIATGPDGRIFGKSSDSNNVHYTNSSWGGARTVSGPDHGCGITTDSYKVYPNDGSSNAKYNVIFAGYNGVWESSTTNLSGAGSGSWTKISNTNINNARGVGCDSENNVWGLGDRRFKVYRMQNNATYPWGGNCRYPAVRLKDHPFTATNTREIEWFLLRDQYEMTGPALSGWMDLVEFNRHEAAHSTTTGAATAVGYNNNRGWRPDPANSVTRVYGIRMKPTLTTSAAISAIRNWDNLYGATNNTGRLLFPNFNRTPNINHAATSGLVASSGNNVVTPFDISTGSGAAVLSYSSGGIDHKRLQCNNYNGFSYIYSDFTGNLLTAGVGETLYNFDIGHPEPSAPTLTLGVTGSNELGFTEGLTQCYPWPFYNDNAQPSIAPDDIVMTFIDEADENSDWNYGGIQKPGRPGEVYGRWSATSGPTSGYYYPSYVTAAYTSIDGTNYGTQWIADMQDWKTYVDDQGYDRNNFLCFNVNYTWATTTDINYITGGSSITPGEITSHFVDCQYRHIWADKCPALTTASVSALSASPVEIIPTPRAVPNISYPWPGGDSLTTQWLTGHFEDKFNITSISPKRVIIYIDVSSSMLRSNIEGEYWINGLEKWSPPVGGPQYGALEGAIKWLEDYGFTVDVYYCNNERWLKWITNAVRGDPSTCSTASNFKRTFASAITSYDDMQGHFTLLVNPGTFITRNWYLNTDDYGYTLQTRSNNNAYLSNIRLYEQYVDMDYTYFNPGIGGREYLDNNVIYNSHATLPGWAGGAVTPKIKDLYTTGVSSGHFIATAWITAQNLYQDTDGSCEMFLSSSVNDILVYERWPEPRFFLDIEDGATFRQDYYHAPTYAPYLDISLYDKSEDLIRLSGKNDAVRKDVTIGVEPLSAIIRDRSISRSYPISSWNFTVSTDNHWLQSNPVLSFVVDHTTVGLNDDIDTQSDFIPLTSFTFQYGANVISLTAQASGTSTISDRLFSQCVNVQEMNPLAYFDVVSGQTIINGSVTGISGYNAWFDGGDPTTGYISGYAPFLNVFFAEKSYPHTFPISSYHWNFGDIYNEGPDDIYDPDSNYYTVEASVVTAGGFTWNVPPKELPLWATDVSNITASHTYIMPGRYNVTLMVKASNTGTMDEYSKFINTDGEEYRYEVYVEEVMPSCGNIVIGTSVSTLTSTSLSSISGNGPLTRYFTLSGFTEGSFPICQLRWQFGDHVETITKYPSAAQTSQGLTIINPTDIIHSIVPYTFDPQVNQSYNIGVSAVVCNTNTIIDCTPVNNMTGIIVSKYNQAKSNMYLLKSRIDENGNIIYLFDDENNNQTTHTIMLSGELSNT